MTGVGIGRKKVRGKPTGVTAICVFVKKKRDVSERQRIPEFIDGVPTDVVEFRPVLHRQSVAASDGGVTEAKKDTKKHLEDTKTRKWQHENRE